MKPLISGLEEVAIYQGFSSFDEAVEAYFAAREKGFVSIKRLATDTDEQWGHRDTAEDLEL